MTAETTIADYFPVKVERADLIPGYYMYFATDKEVEGSFKVSEIILVLNTKDYYTKDYYIMGDDRSMALFALDGTFYSLACLEEQIGGTPEGQQGVYNEIAATLLARPESTTNVLTDEELESLTEASAFMDALAAAGVDNWEGYERAQEILTEWDEELPALE